MTNTSKKTLTQKILEPHIIEGAWVPGEEIGIRIDQTLTQDATGTMAYLQFEAMGFPRVKTQSSVSFIDHNTIQIGFENADDHNYLRTVAAKFGIQLSRAGNGVCHQVHLERFGVPGTTLLGSDSHTPTGGGLGQIAIGAGGLDVAVAMGGGPFFLTCPKVVKANLTGKLGPWATAKDVVLKMLEEFTTQGNVGVVIEYDGPGVASLSVPERATITNMGAEMGVTTSIFPSDDVTRKFLEAQERGRHWKALAADPGAPYDKVVEIDLSKIEPLAAAPHSPGNIKRVKELEGMAVDQVMIGSCTNGSYLDLKRVAAILKGQTVHPAVSVGIAPGSRQVLQMLAKDGSLYDLVSAGVRVLESCCGFCIGNSISPQTKSVSLRTSNRNFLARSGTKDASVYLVSPETAAVAALTGRITDPRGAGIPWPVVEMPEKFIVDDSMVIPPSEKPEQIEIFRGPNIGTPPRNDAFPRDLDAEVAIVVGDKITTDHIIPAGARMKYRSNVPKYSEFVFETVDPQFHVRCKEIRGRDAYPIIVAGESYGQGSSREHAALCPMYLGVKVVLSKTMERIHQANLCNFGILPLSFTDAADYATIAQGDRLSIADVHGQLARGTDVTVKNTTKGLEYKAKAVITERQRDYILAGGLLNHTTQKK
jgi:aconitate hydratase